MANYRATVVQDDRGIRLEMFDDAQLPSAAEELEALALAVAFLLGRAGYGPSAEIGFSGGVRDFLAGRINIPGNVEIRPDALSEEQDPSGDDDTPGDDNSSGNGTPGTRDNPDAGDRGGRVPPLGPVDPCGPGSHAVAVNFGTPEAPKWATVCVPD